MALSDKSGLEEAFGSKPKVPLEDPDDEELDAAQEILDAIRSRDASALKAALHLWKEACAGGDASDEDEDEDEEHY